MITKEQQQSIWHTKTLLEFSNKNYDNILYPSNIVGTETYLTKDKKHIEGYEATKLHSGDKQPTVYFIRTQDMKLLPFEIQATSKVHDKSKVFNLIYQLESVRMNPQKVIGWKQIIDLSGIPNHTKPLHHTLYKMKRLYARTKGQVYTRVVTESGFGKDKYTEAYRHLINESSVISDPSVANLFFRACYNKDISINELPDDSNKKEFNKLCNLFMRIGDASNVIDNRSRGVNGSKDTADSSKLSVTFTHNVPNYYLNKGRRCFFQIYPYNVYNRYYPVLYEGYLQADFPMDMNHKALAEEHRSFIITWIKSVLWYEANWHGLTNMYPNIPLDQFKFKNSESRFKDHFKDFAKCISHYAQSEREYLELLKEDYDCHKRYEIVVECLDEDNGPLVTTEKLL